MKKLNTCKKLISSILAFALLTQIVGCYSYQEITIEEFVQTEEYSDLRVKTKDKNWYEFYKNDYIVKEDSIYGSGRLILKTGIEFNEDFTGSISLKEIESIKFDRIDTELTIIWSTIGVGVIVLIGVIIDDLVNFKIGPIFGGKQAF